MFKNKPFQWKQGFNIKNIVISLFVLFNLADIYTTLFVYFTKPHFNESNIIYNVTGSVWIMILVKIIIVGLMTFFAFKYHLMPYQLQRYLFVWIFVLVTFLLFSAVITNIQVGNTPAEEMGIVEKEDRIAHAQERIGRLKAVPLASTLTGLLILNTLQFVVWQSFEKHNRRKLSLQRWLKKNCKRKK